MPFFPAVFGPLQALINVFEQVLLFFHDHVGVGWGLSIIFLTITVRAILFPLTLKQIKSMRAMQQLAPEIKALQAKYKDDRERLNQEMMKFYQENEVNPFGSCLPLIAQLPVFISLFYMLRKDLKEDICGDPLNAYLHAHPSATLTTTGCDKVDPGSAQFWFIPDLTHPATGGVLILLLALYVGSQLLSSIFMSATMDKNQRLLMIGMPFFFVLLVRNFPAGLLVYWITTNLWTFGQGVIVRRRHPPITPATALAASGGGGKGKTASAPVAERSKGKETEPAPVGATAGGGSGAAPPPPPRKKKKRSGRRR